LVNTAGGVTGGDRLSLDVTVGEGADLSITTQAAERAYRAQPNEVGHITTNITVKADAIMKWLPQEMILFDRSSLNRRLNIDLAETARLLMVEPLVFGRSAMDETLTNIDFCDRIIVTRGKTPLYLDQTVLRGDVASHLARPAIANSAGAMANMVFVAPNASDHLREIQDLLPASGGVSLLDDDILVMRLLASDSFELRRTLIPVLENITHTSLPLSWSL